MARLRPPARSAVLRRPRDPVPGRLGRRRGHSHRPAREHRDHARRPRRDAPVRQRRCRRDRADGVGAEEVRHGGARRRGPHDDVHGAALQRLHGRAAVRRPRPVHGRDPRRRLVRDDGRAGALRRCRDRHRRQRPARQARRVAAAPLAGAGRQRRARRAPPAAPWPRRPARRADVVGVRHRLPVGVLRGLRRLPGRRHPRRGLLRRHAGQHAAAARAASAASTAA